MYLVNNVLENQIWAVPLLHYVFNEIIEWGCNNIIQSVYCE